MNNIEFPSGTTTIVYDWFDAGQPEPVKVLKALHFRTYLDDVGWESGVAVPIDPPVPIEPGVRYRVTVEGGVAKVRRLGHPYDV